MPTLLTTTHWTSSEKVICQTTNESGVEVWKCLVCKYHGARKKKNIAPQRRARKANQAHQGNDDNDSNSDDEAKPDDQPIDVDAEESSLEDDRFEYIKTNNLFLNNISTNLKRHFHSQHGMDDNKGNINQKIVNEFKKKYPEAICEATEQRNILIKSNNKVALGCPTIRTFARAGPTLQKVLNIFARHKYAFKNIESDEWRDLIKEDIPKPPKRRAFRLKMFEEKEDLNQRN